jgi:type III pantothenate kinase
VLRVVADLGNTRLKWGLVDESGRLTESIALPLDEPAAWAAAWQNWNDSGVAPSLWAISSVNPPLANPLRCFLEELGNATGRWFRSAADVDVDHELVEPETAGADRAFAVAAAISLAPAGRPGLVISCGTAITVERISRRGIWEGGAIAPGLGVTARALHHHTAQLPLVELPQAPPHWGASTRPALEAGIFWGTVGAVRELVARQTADLGKERWVMWTGGDAALLAGAVDGPLARIEPDLVLIGLCGALASSHDQYGKIRDEYE